MVFIGGLVCVASGAWSLACSVNRTCLLDWLGFESCPVRVFRTRRVLVLTLCLNAKCVSAQW